MNPVTHQSSRDEAINQKHFHTGHLLGNIRGLAISGGLITLGAQAIRFLLYIVWTVALSRLLSKEDFGLVAMVATLSSFLRLFREAGLATATVQQETITHAQVSNLFWLNVLLGLIAALIGACLSPVLAWFYRDPRLVAITIVLSSTFILSGSAVQHLGLLNRQMRFQAQACVDITATVLSLVVGVAMALSGCGYWSLVGSQCALSVGELSMAWIMSRWRPQLPKSGSGIRSMVHFGASLTISQIFVRLAGGTDSILIGRLYGAGPLGIYSRGMALLMRPLDQFSAPIEKVFIPVLSRLQNQQDRYRRSFLQVYEAIVLASLLIAGLFLGLSKPLVLVLLGSRWIEVVPIFAALSIVGTYYVPCNASLWLPTTQGRNRDILTTGILNSVISVAAFATGIHWGPFGVALSIALCGLFVRLPMIYHIAGKTGPVSAADLWRSLLFSLPVWVAVTASTFFAAKAAEGYGPLIQLCVAAPVGLAAGLLTIWSLPERRRIAARVVGEVWGFVSRTLFARSAA